MPKITHVLIIILLVALHTMPLRIAYTHTSTWEHLCYIFFHANIFHLIGNCYCTYYILNNRTYPYTKTLLILYITSVLASFLAVNKLPTLGFSAPLFAMTGINLYTSKNKKKYIIPLTLTITTGLLFPLINTPLHLLCALLAYCYTAIDHFIKHLIYDSARTNR